MIYISHRGNINGKNPERENSPDYILEAIDKGYEVEVDLWLLKDKWYFGHNEPTYDVGDLGEYLKYFNKIWFHCKNLEAFGTLLVSKNFIVSGSEHNYSLDNNEKFFWHQNDDFTLTSTNKIWTYPGKELCDFSIAVLPETVNYADDELKNCYGICSDFIEKYKYS